MEKGILYLTKTELEQLESYLDNRDRFGWYYGKKTDFNKRHNNLKKAINNTLIYIGARKPTQPETIRVVENNMREAKIIRKYKNLLSEKNEEIRALKIKIKELEVINGEINNHLEDIKRRI